MTGALKRPPPGLTKGIHVIGAILTALFHLVMPLGWLLVLARRRPSSSVVRALNLLGCLSFIAFNLYAGAGWASLGWYTRWVLVAVSLPLWLVAALGARGVPVWPQRLRGWASGVGALLACLLFVSSFAQLAASPGAAAAPVRVQNPLPAGDYLVLHGGDHEAVNHHVQVRAQRHALDIVALNGAGFRARGLAPAELAAYAIYGTPVLAPCAGEVLVARDGLDDLPVGQPGAAGQAAPLGNTVLIHCTSDITVVLAHLRPHSVRVAAGDVVALGDALGAVGNSGNTSEPHLHMHAVRGRVADPVQALAHAEPVPLSIEGRSPVRNDRLAGSDWVLPMQASR